MGDLKGEGALTGGMLHFKFKKSQRCMSMSLFLCPCCMLNFKKSQCFMSWLLSFARAAVPYLCPCRMSNLRHPNVACFCCLFLPVSHVEFKKSQCHMTLSLFFAHVTFKFKTSQCCMSLLLIFASVELKKSHC